MQVLRFADLAAAGGLQGQGPWLAAKFDATGKGLASPERALVAIVAGSKVSTKLTILPSLAEPGLANEARAVIEAIEHDIDSLAFDILARRGAQGAAA